MVDLAKIRKKAKDKKAAAASVAAQSVSEPAPAASPAPVATAAAEPEQDKESSQKTRKGVEPLDEASVGGSRLDQFKATAGQVRRFSSQVGSDHARGEAEKSLELLTFVIASERYAIEIEKIVEIILPRLPTRVPNTDPTIVGVISLRGTIVTLLDVRQRLGHPPAPVDPNLSRIIVIEQSGEIAGFLVDRVTRVIKVPESEVETHPVVHHEEQNPSIRGVFQQEGRLTILLDLDALIR